MDTTTEGFVLTIVQFLAKAANHVVKGQPFLTPIHQQVFDRNFEALIKQDSDPFVRNFLGMVKEAHGVLTVDQAKKLKAYP